MLVVDLCDVMDLNGNVINLDPHWFTTDQATSFTNNYLQVRGSGRINSIFAKGAQFSCIDIKFRYAAGYTNASISKAVPKSFASGASI